jgi:hypothetical protein
LNKVLISSEVSISTERAVPADLLYYPIDGQYWANLRTIYAQYRRANAPNPCRKYHVSADVDGAEHVVAALPYLAAQQVAHKVVQSRSALVGQSAGNQAGKFITIYMPAEVTQKNQWTWARHSVTRACDNRAPGTRQLPHRVPCAPHWPAR